MAVRIGPVNAKFKGRLQLSDIVPMQSYKINFDGQGGVAGFGKGSADVTLAPGRDRAARRRKLNYTADAQVGGKIAQIGSRLVESAAAKIADDFFKAFEARMTAPAGWRDAATAPRAAVRRRRWRCRRGRRRRWTMSPAGARARQPRRRDGGSTIWWIAGIIVLALLAYFFTR